MTTVKRWFRNHWGKCLGFLIVAVILAGIRFPAVANSARYRPKTPFDLAHERAVNTFVDSKGYVINEIPVGDDPGWSYAKVIAPILARESGLKCHEVEAGELLGAFCYDTLRRPKRP